MYELRIYLGYELRIDTKVRITNIRIREFTKNHRTRNANKHEMRKLRNSCLKGRRNSHCIQNLKIIHQYTNPPIRQFFNAGEKLDVTKSTAVR